MAKHEKPIIDIEPIDLFGSLTVGNLFGADTVVSVQTMAMAAGVDSAVMTVAEPEPVLEPEIVTPPAEKPHWEVYWREGEYLRSAINPARLTVVLGRRAESKIIAIPWTLESAAEMLYLSEIEHACDRDDRFGNAWSFSKHRQDGAILFPDTEFVCPDPEHSKLVCALRECGFDVVIPPSILNWAKKEYRHRLRVDAPFDLPVVKDDRPLFDRLELGMMVHCTQSKGPFFPGFSQGYNYVVSETDQIELNEEEEDKADTEKAETGTIFLVREGTSQILKWTELDGDMEPYFELPLDQMKIFDAEKVFPKAYPELYNAARKKVEKQGLPLFDYVAKDTAQAVYHKYLPLTHFPRMGKTSQMIAYVETAGSKRALMATVSNGVRVFEKEFKRLGLTDYKVLENVNDFDHPAKYHICSHSWLKTGGRKMPKAEKLLPQRTCPDCQGPLTRIQYMPVKEGNKFRRNKKTGKRLLVPDIGVIDQKIKWLRSDQFGYECVNAECPGGKHGLPALDRTKAKCHKGARNFGVELFGPGGRHIDVDLKMHTRCIDGEQDKFDGRACKCCGYVHQSWLPGRYKRIGKRYSVICTDEVHHIKSGTSMEAKSILGTRKAKRRVCASGTLMPTKPRDCFYPFLWTFGPKNHWFPFRWGQTGVGEFNAEYTQTITMVSSNNTRYKKAVPYVKKPAQFSEWRSRRALGRHYQDPEAIAAFAKAGLVIPNLKAIPVELVPDPRQGILLVATIADFDQRFNEYSKDLKQKTAESKEGKTHLLNSSQVIARMHHMKYASSIPGFLNEKIVAEGGASIYTGAYGGVKTNFIVEKVAEKVMAGEKVVIFSDHKPMQAHLAEVLALYNPILFHTGWGQKKRDQMFQKFEDDDSVGVFIGGPRSINESIDLSAGGKARTVISPDLLWSPGLQTQAWARILTPKPVERECELYVLLTKYSIDSHIYSTFYGRIAAAEQALYDKLLTKADKGFDVKYFVDQILREKGIILEWLIESGFEAELDYLPVFHQLAELSLETAE